MTDPKVEAFYAGAKDWQAELVALRGVLRRAPLVEEFKWRNPCYTFEGGNVCIVWGFKDACALGFFKGTLLKDSAGILLAHGEHSRAMRTVKFTSVAEVEAAEAVVQAYILEAIALEKSGAKVVFEKDDLDWPEELVRKCEADPAFHEAFISLTPGRQRGWILHVSQAAQSATRASRIEKATPKILAGKGMNDR